VKKKIDKEVKNSKINRFVKKLENTISQHYDKIKLAMTEIQKDDYSSKSFVTHLKRLGVYFKDNEYCKKDNKTRN